MPSVVSPGLSVAPIAGLDGYAGEVQGGAYISWLQSALQQQSGVLNEREQSIKHLEDRLREATQMLALGRKSDADIDPEGFLIERIVDEEEKCAKLTAKVQEQAREILEKDGGMASMEDELRSLQAQLRELREERREDMVRTHSDWADAHLIYSPHSLPLEAVGTLVSDLQSRRADVLHLAQRLEDWNAALTVHYYKALQQQQRLPKRGQSGIASFTAEIKKISDSLFHRLRGECLQLTHDELSVLSQGHLSRCRADTTTFLQAFRRFKNIIRSVGMPVTDPNSTCWLQNEIRIEAMLSRMDTSARAQLIESAREMVLCYDTNPRTIQSSHGKLLEELSMNLKTVVAALRIAASPVNISVTGTQRVFPVNLSDARLVDRDGRAPNTSKRRPNSAGPRPSSRATTTTPTAASHRAGSRDSVTSRASSQSSQPNLKAGRLSTPRSISPYVRTTNAPPSSSPATTLPSPRVSAVRGRVASPGWVQRYKPDPGDPSPVPNGKLLVSTTPPAARNGYGAGGCPPPPDIEPAAARSNQASLNAGAAIPLRLPGKPQPPPPPQRANGSPAPAVIITNSTTTAALTSARAVFSDNHTPVRPYGRAGAATTPSAATPTAPQAMLSTHPEEAVNSSKHGTSSAPALPVRQQHVNSTPKPVSPLRSNSVQPPTPAPDIHTPQVSTPAALSTDDMLPMDVIAADDPDGFLSEAQRKEVKERAMGNFRTSFEDGEEELSESRAEMTRKLMSWSGEIGNKLAKRKNVTNQLRPDDEEYWTDEEYENPNDPWSAESDQEFDVPLNITHPDYTDPELSAGPGILRTGSQNSMSSSWRNVTFAQNTKVYDGPNENFSD